MAKRVRVVASGRVQGVFYRATCADLARSRGLAGFVRNIADGRVEACFEGPDGEVDAMVDWCRTGTDWARVDRLDVFDEPVRGDHGFRVTR